MNLKENLQTRFATKKFDSSKKVSEDKIQRILEAGNLSASSIGIQPYKFIMVKNEDKRKELGKHSFGQPQPTEASHLLVIATRTNIDQDYLSNYIEFCEKEKGLPAGTLNEFKQMCSGFISTFDTKEKLDNWTSKQAYLAMGTLLIACAEEGVDSVPMEGFVPQMYDEILGLEEKNLKSVLILPIGYAAEDDKYKSLNKVRRPLDYMTEEI